MQRVSVVGNSGSGKTTIAAELARLIGAPHLELDSVFHQPGWVPLPEPEFRTRVTELIAAPRWVVDGNYSAVRDLVWSRADTVVWLDLPRWQVMRQVVGRTVRRAARRAELWNGNVEPWSNFLHLDPGAVHHRLGLDPAPRLPGPVPAGHDRPGVRPPQVHQAVVSRRRAGAAGRGG
jgi:adenylate kinase family enzyme